MVALVFGIITGLTAGGFGRGQGGHRSPEHLPGGRMPCLPQTSLVRTCRHPWACVFSPPGIGHFARDTPTPRLGTRTPFPLPPSLPRLALHTPPPHVCFSVCVSLSVSVTVSSLWHWQPVGQADRGRDGDSEETDVRCVGAGQGQAAAGPGQRTGSRWLLQRRPRQHPEGESVGACPSCPRLWEGTPPS